MGKSIEGVPKAEDDCDVLDQLHQAALGLEKALEQVIVGQQATIRQILVSLFSGGHCLLIGVPGLAKTLIIQSLASLLHLEFRRIQFTPDLMPSDIVGTEVIQEDQSNGKRAFRFLPGPIFSNILLADEVNRTPPKTQAALLEAMQERQVTAGGKRHPLPSPFFVLATQNPIEQEGTYPLPEAQLDRFMFNVLVDYPSEEEELRVILETTSDRQVNLAPMLDGPSLLKYSQLIRRIPIAESTARFAMRLARGTRPNDEHAPPLVKKCVSWGAGPRASQFLVLGAKALAAIQGRAIVTEEDIQAVAAPVLRHRIRTNFHAEAEGVRPEQIIDAVFESVQSSLNPSKSREYFSQVFRS